MSTHGVYSETHASNNRMNNFRGPPTVYPVHGNHFTRDNGNGLSGYANAVRNDGGSVVGGMMQHAEFGTPTGGCDPAIPQYSGQSQVSNGGQGGPAFHMNVMNSGPNQGMDGRIGTTNNRNTFEKVKLCRFGKSCRKMGSGCEFSHETIQRLCRSGVECGRKDTCLFLHKLTSERSLMVNGFESNSKNPMSRW